MRILFMQMRENLSPLCKYRKKNVISVGQFTNNNYSKLLVTYGYFQLILIYYNKWYTRWDFVRRRQVRTWVCKNIQQNLQNSDHLDELFRFEETLQMSHLPETHGN